MVSTPRRRCPHAAPGSSGWDGARGVALPPPRGRRITARVSKPWRAAGPRRCAAVRHFDISRCSSSALDGRVRRRLLHGGFGRGSTGMGLEARLRFASFKTLALWSRQPAIAHLPHCTHLCRPETETGCLRVAWDALASLAAARRSARRVAEAGFEGKRVPRARGPGAGEPRIRALAAASHAEHEGLGSGWQTDRRRRGASDGAGTPSPRRLKAERKHASSGNAHRFIHAGHSSQIDRQRQTRESQKQKCRRAK